MASSSAAIGKHFHLVSASRSSAHKGGSDASSGRDTDTHLIVFTQLGLPSMMVSTTAIDCRTSFRDAGTMPRHKCWLVSSHRHICAKVPCSPPISVSDTCSSNLRSSNPLHVITFGFGYHLYSSSADVCLRTSNSPPHPTGHFHDVTFPQCTQLYTICSKVCSTYTGVLRAH